MQIISASDVTEEQKEQIKNLVRLCAAYEPISDEVAFDHVLNFDQNIKCYFFLFIEEQLIAYLSMFIPTADVAEISAYTHPEFRRKGYFSLLFKEAKNELENYEIDHVLFVHQPSGKDAKHVIEKYGADIERTEYLMELDTAQFSKLETELKLTKANEAYLNEMAAIYPAIFHDVNKDTESALKTILDTEHFDTYLLYSDDTIIGMCNVNRQEDKFYIFGLGILPEYRNQGYGKQMISLLLEELILIKNKRILLEVSSDNQSAFALYKNSGFIVQQQYDYYKYVI